MDYLDHMNGALNAIHDAAAKTPPADRIRTSACLSLCAADIAQSLSDAQHLTVGAEPRPLNNLILSQREYFQQRADLAIASLAPQFYEDIKENVVGTMLNAQFQQSMDDEALIRETLSVFLVELARPVLVQR